MANNVRKNWTREETILAFELYCRTAFGKIHAGNPEIIDLANLINRTPAAVAYKMFNLAAHDPELQARSIKGLTHGSKMDAIVFNEFYQNLEELEFNATNIKTNFYNVNVMFKTDLIDFNEMPVGEYRERLVKTRLGQYAFRLSVLNAYHNRCCITGVTESKLLIASHIKPWAVSNEVDERTNPKNGLCLNSFHDRAFDQGFITIDQNYHVLVSDRLKEVDMDKETKDWLMAYHHKSIILPDKFLPKKEFIEYHNDVIFLG